MPASAIPTTGLGFSLVPDPPSKTVGSVIQLDLATTVLESVINDARKEKRDMQVCVGRKPGFWVPQGPLCKIDWAEQRPPALLYHQTAADDMRFVARLPRKLVQAGLKKADVVEELDPATMALQQGLASLAQEKQAKTAVFLKNSKDLVTAKRGKGGSIRSSALAASIEASNHRKVLAEATTRSMPASPAFGALSPAPRNTQQSMVQEAAKRAMIHLLAVRPVSESYVSATIKMKSADLQTLLHKYARPNRLDPRKLDLSDRGYKELDVWSFRYPSPEDRQLAIDRAISAFDRQRISREESIWQMLLPKQERGRGKILSKLQLHGGTMDRVPPPRIQVESAGQAARSGEVSSGQEDATARLAPGDAEPMVRSQSTDSITKKRVSQMEAQSKRLLSKNPGKHATMATSKVEKPVKAATKIRGTKSTLPPSGKVKSAEFVTDSDGDADIPPPAQKAPVTVEKPRAKPNTSDATSLSRNQAPTRRPDPKGITPSEAPKLAKSANQARSAVRPAATPDASREKSSPRGLGLKDLPADMGSTGMARTGSHKRKTSSPIKPSPLGSSPPTNASDLDARVPTQLASQKKNDHAPAHSTTTTTAAPTAPRPLKRKAADVSSAHVPASSSDDYARPPKRSTPPSSSDSSTTVNGATSRLRIRPDALPLKVPLATLELAHTAMTEQARYDRLYAELRAMDDPPEAEMRKLFAMNERLVDLSAKIYHAMGAKVPVEGTEGATE